MTQSHKHQTLRALLEELQSRLIDDALWHATPPSPQRLASTAPFAADTLELHEWLQWVFVPRMHALLDANAPLPERSNIRAYAEVCWQQGMPRARPVDCDQVLALLGKIDQTLNDP